MKDCLTTYTGVSFDTFEPQMEMIKIEDIAHALSMMTRANGHFPEFFSVGQHSIQCCREAIARNYVPEVVMACLLHDASEAYLADITRPVKKNMTMYIQIEEQLQNMIYEKFLGFVPQGEAQTPATVQTTRERTREQMKALPAERHTRWLQSRREILTMRRRPRALRK